jgi:hypothetical protein
VSAFVARWNAFWFALVDGGQLARVRLLVGLALVVKLTGTYGLVPRLWYGKFEPGFPVHEYGHKTWWGEQGYSDPFVAAFGFTDFDHFRVLEDALFAFAILFFVGAGGRVVGVITLVLYALWFNASALAFSHNELLLFVSLAIVGVSPCTDRFSVDALARRWFRAHAPPPPLRSIQPLRMLQVLVSTIYAFTFIAKLNKGWLTGIALHDALLLNAPRFKALRFIMGILPDHDVVYAPGMWIVLAIEAFLAFAFWFPRTRRTALVLGILFHLGIELTMDVGAYSFAICALYAAFFPLASRRPAAPVP